MGRVEYDDIDKLRDAAALARSLLAGDSQSRDELLAPYVEPLIRAAIHLSQFGDEVEEAIHRKGPVPDLQERVREFGVLLNEYSKLTQGLADLVVALAVRLGEQTNESADAILARYAHWLAEFNPDDFPMDLEDGEP